MSDITIQVTLNQQQAKKFLQWLGSQYTLTMAEVWYSDRYRHVPAGERGRKVLSDVPYLSGISRTQKALEQKLRSSATERAL